MVRSRRPSRPIVLLLGLSALLDACDGTAPWKSWRWYCAPSELIAEHRKIPKLPAGAAGRDIKVVQVLAMTRHGARTPVNWFPGCWTGYNQTWNCEVPKQGLASVNNANIDSPEEFAGEGGERGNSIELLAESEEGAFAKSSYIFEKHFGDPMAKNVLNGSCQRGQLTAEGVLQHRELGAVFANAYFPSSDKTDGDSPWKEPLFSREEWEGTDNASDLIYFRSTPSARTELSGTNFLTSMMDSMYGGVQRSKIKPPRMTTVDGEQDYFLNQDSVNLAVAADSPKAAAIRHSGFELYSQLNEALNFTKDMWSEHLYDCLMTTACDPQRYGTELPAIFLEQPNLLDTFSQFATKESLFPYLWNNGIVSRNNMRSFLFELRLSMLRTVCNDCNDDNMMHTLTQRLSLQLSDSRDEILRMPTRPLMYWSAHDKNIVGILISIHPQLFDRIWPPYASLLAFEVIMEGSKPFFRIVYNSQDITHRLPTCPKDDLCPLKELLQATEWVHDEQYASAVRRRRNPSCVEVAHAAVTEAKKAWRHAEGKPSPSLYLSAVSAFGCTILGAVLGLFAGCKFRQMRSVSWLKLNNMDMSRPAKTG